MIGPSGPLYHLEPYWGLPASVNKPVAYRSVGSFHVKQQATHVGKDVKVTTPNMACKRNSLVVESTNNVELGKSFDKVHIQECWRELNMSTCDTSLRLKRIDQWQVPP
jgi:hypothetical protein